LEYETETGDNIWGIDMAIDSCSSRHFQTYFQLQSSIFQYVKVSMQSKISTQVDNMLKVRKGGNIIADT
jgi:tRNA isopentenyl-2-thiomethyl-A-37 hydroxylase MiaE